MLNIRKVFGILLGLAGAAATKVSFFFEADSSRVFFVKTAGVLIACVGIAVFASGIEKKTEKKIRICPECYKKNDAENSVCQKCKRPLAGPSKE